MICWCEKIKSYNCGECEKSQAWERVPFADRLDLLAYVKQLKLNRADQKLAEKIINKNLCVSMIPKQASL